MQHDKQVLYSHITEIILACSFSIMNELGTGFLESVYKNALVLALHEHGLNVEVEKRFEVKFRGRLIGIYVADLVVESSVIVELKCCGSLHGDLQAQLINYLKASGILVGLLINFGKRKLEYKRLLHPHASAGKITV